MIPPKLRVEDLAKRYGAQVAVAGITFEVAPGEVVGLLGPNGAGKTTTVAMIAGLIRPDAGRVLVDGAAFRGDADPRKRRLGLVPQELALVEELGARANLRLFAALYDLGGAAARAAVARCLDLVGLANRADEPTRTFSGGMKRRLNLAAALLHDPDLIVLDEPTVGIDPQSRVAIFEGLDALKRAGKSLLYTTHYMEEAERLCDRLVIVDGGRVVADDTLAGLARLVPAANRLILGCRGAVEEPQLALARATPGVVAVARAEGGVGVDLADLAVVPRVLDALAAGGVAVTALASERTDLQAIFLALTGRGVRDS